MLCSLLRLSSREQTFPPVSVFLRALAGAERFPALAQRSQEPPQLLRPPLTPCASPLRSGSLSRASIPRCAPSSAPGPQGCAERYGVPAGRGSPRLPGSRGGEGQGRARWGRPRGTEPAWAEFTCTGGTEQWHPRVGQPS